MSIITNYIVVGIILDTVLCPYTGQNIQSGTEFYKLNLKPIITILIFANHSDENNSKNHLVLYLIVTSQIAFFHWLDT